MKITKGLIIFFAVIGLLASFAKLRQAYVLEGRILTILAIEDYTEGISWSTGMFDNRQGILCKDNESGHVYYFSVPFGSFGVGQMFQVHLGKKIRI
jgi:hypothetical protein